VPFESYYPGCTPFWWVVSSENNILKPFIEAGKKNNSAFANLTETPHILREEMLQSCSRNQSCPFPTYNLVIDVSQVYCGGFFHWSIEIWPRIAPFLDALLAHDMPDFAIRIGCEMKDFHRWFFYDLVRLKKVEIIWLGTVFAKEVIVPTEGFAHSPLLSYWNLVSIRRHVVQRIGGGGIGSDEHSEQKKIVMVIVRDGSRRGDNGRCDDYIFDERFFQQLSTGLGSGYNVTAFRSSDVAMSECLECQARAFMAADVIVGSHGAGLSHIMFSKRGGIVLERMAGDNDSGIYSELSFLVGIKYFPMKDDAGALAYRDIILFADRY